MLYLHLILFNVCIIIYEVERRYVHAFRSYLYNYFFLTFSFLKSNCITKKIVKVIQDEICSKLFEIYKQTENVALVKFVEAIPVSGSQFF